MLRFLLPKDFLKRSIKARRRVEPKFFKLSSFAGKERNVIAL